MRYRVDFHVHSTVSDGSLGLVALAEAAREAGLGALVVTDHDLPDNTFRTNKKILRALMEFGYNPPIPIIIGAEINTPSGEFLLFGQKAIKQWFNIRGPLEKVYDLFGFAEYWKMFHRQVLHANSWEMGGGVTSKGKAFFTTTKKHPLPYAMIMCHPRGSLRAYEAFPKAMYKLLHGFEVENSGQDLEMLYPENIRYLREVVPGGRELKNSDAHLNEVGRSYNEIVVDSGKPLDEGKLISWLRGERGKIEKI